MTSPKTRVINPGNTRGVLQGESAITNSACAWHILGSCGAMPCVIVALYNARTKTASLAHIDAVTDPVSAVLQLQIGLTGPGDFLDAHLATGNTSRDNATLASVKEAITDHQHLLLHDEVTSSSFAINAVDGSTHVKLKKAQFDHGVDIYERQVERCRRTFVLRDRRLILSFDGTARPPTVGVEHQTPQAIAYWNEMLRRSNKA